MLFASFSACMISVCREILPYDKFKQDLKIITKITFSELELYTIPDSIDSRKKIYWLEDTKTKLNLDHLYNFAGNSFKKKSDFIYKNFISKSSRDNSKNLKEGEFGINTIEENMKHNIEQYIFFFLI